MGWVANKYYGIVTSYFYFFSSNCPAELLRAEQKSKFPQGRLCRSVSFWLGLCSCALSFPLISFSLLSIGWDPQRTDMILGYVCVPCKAPHSTSQQLSLDSFWHCPLIKFNRIFPLIGKNSSGLEPFSEWEGEPASWQSSAPRLSTELVFGPDSISVQRARAVGSRLPGHPRTSAHRRVGREKVQCPDRVQLYG